MLSQLGALAVLLAAPVNAACQNGCSGHGSCGLLGTCICEGSWAGRDCSFQLSLDTEVSEKNVAMAAMSSMPPLAADPLDSAQLVLGTKGRHLQDQSQEITDITDASVRSFAQSRRAAESAWATADKPGVPESSTGLNMFEQCTKP